MSTFEGNYPQLMAAYNAWMNERLYAACDQVPDEERRRDRGAFFKSIHGTLNHILWGDRSWLARLGGPVYPTGPVAEDLYADFDELRAVRRATDQEIIAWARGLDQAWLDTPMTWTSKIYGFTQTHPRWVQVVQLFNHQTHHRGQLHTLLTQVGVDMGATDVPVLPLLAGTEG
jgi:uncharacterized damage-inducible protein DinB